MDAMPHLLVYGLGYTGTAIARAAVARGWRVTATVRRPDVAAPPGVALVPFDDAAPGDATHVVATAAPDAAGDPALVRHGAALAASPHLRWAGYLSTTGVYGDRNGGWVDEDTPPAPGNDRGHRRIAAEAGWAAFGARIPVDLIRLAGIYGPGRSALDEIRAGRGRRVIKPGHAFGRIHRTDIAEGVLAAAAQVRAPGVRVLNFSDDEPAEAARVQEEAAALLGREPPPEVDFAEAVTAMSEMGRSFWLENRRVASAKTQAALGRNWRYPTYREGLRAILAEEGVDRALQQGQVRRP
jgi:nucleoside-diphosphate-sugar epimerase